MANDLKGQSYLITGGASLIGSHIADQLLAGGAAEVRLFDNFSLGTQDTIAHLQGDPRVRLIRGDVLRLNEMIDAGAGTQGVFALAGFLTLPMSQNPTLGISVNTLGMVNTLEACRIARVGRIVFSSSVSTYGGSVGEVISEETPYTSAGLQPSTQLYSASKLLGEALCAQYAKSCGLEFNALRFASVYGERQHRRAVNALFIAQTYDSVREGRRPVISGDGSEVHDYIHVTDVARACVLAMTAASHGHVLNIATGVDTTLTRVAELVLKACGARDLAPEYREDTRAVKSAPVTKLNFSRARAEHSIGWRPLVTIEDGIARFIRWSEGQP